MPSITHALPSLLQGKVRPAKDCELFIVDDASLVFSEGMQQVFALDTIATWVWIAVEDNQDLDLLTNELCLTARIRPHDGFQIVNNLLKQWADLGLLAGTEQNRMAVDRSKADPSIPPNTIVSPEPLTEWASVRCYTLLNTVFRIHYGSREQEQMVHPILAHLECHEDPGPPRDVFLVRTETEFRIIYNYRIYHSGREAREIAPAVKSFMTCRALDNHDYAFQIHAGAVERDGFSLLLPAEAGRGKTCLVARLIQRGWRYLSDEYAPLCGDQLSVAPIPLSMATKVGAWALLQPYYPAIAELPIHLREDSKTVRYLPPPVSSIAPAMSEGFPVKWIVFPSYEPKGETHFTRLSKIEVLRRLFEQCVSLPGRLNSQVLMQVTRWVDNVEGYELSNSNLEEAVDCLNAMASFGSHRSNRVEHQTTSSRFCINQEAVS